MGRLIGIDLGTTNSVVAVMQGQRPAIVENREGQPQTRSIVSLRTRGDELEMLVGDAALANWPLNVEGTVVSIKRLMGRGVADEEVQRVRQWAQYAIVEPSDGTKDSVRVVLGGQEYSPIDVSATILRKLKEDTEFRLGDEVTHAVITVPAYFSHIQKDATRRAGERAGLRVIKILDEPTAAAIAYGMDDPEPRNLLVYDLGGGTFDISVLFMSGGVFAPLNLEGDMWLGGDNFDQVVVERVVEHVRREYPGVDPLSKGRFMVDLRRAAQRAKETLSSSRSTDLIVSGLLSDAVGLVDVSIELTREEFEELIRPLVERTVRITERALTNAGLTTDDVHFVLMAGNATTTPLVQEAMERMFGAGKVLRRVHPKQSVALGAALVAAIIGPRVVCAAPDAGDPSRECGEVNEDRATSCARCGAPLEEPPPAPVALTQIVDIAAFHYGIPTDGRFSVFVNKGDPYPTAEPRMEVFQTRVPNARMINIPVFGRDDPEAPTTDERQGDAFAILPPGLPSDTNIRIRLWLGANGRFELSAHLDDGTDLKPWVVEKGEAHDKAIATLERVDEVLGLKSQRATPAQLGEVERVREQVFGELRRGEERYAQALAAVERLEKMVLGLGEELPVKNLVEFTSSVTSQFRWAFDPAKADRLDDLVEKTKAAVDAGDPDTVATRFRQLDEETDQLPEPVVVLLSLLQVIAERVYPYDPGTADSLIGELREVHDVWSGTGREAAEQRLKALVPRIEAAVAAMPAPPGGYTCPNGHVYPGGRRCPICNADSWAITKRAG